MGKIDDIHIDELSYNELKALNNMVSNKLLTYEKCKKNFIKNDELSKNIANINPIVDKDLSKLDNECRKNVYNDLISCVYFLCDIYLHNFSVIDHAYSFKVPVTIKRFDRVKDTKIVEHYHNLSLDIIAMCEQYSDIIYNIERDEK